MSRQDPFARVVTPGRIYRAPEDEYHHNSNSTHGKGGHSHLMSASSSFNAQDGRRNNTFGYHSQRRPAASAALAPAPPAPALAAGSVRLPAAVGVPESRRRRLGPAVVGGASNGLAAGKPRGIHRPVSAVPRRRRTAYSSSAYSNPSPSYSRKRNTRRRFHFSDEEDSDMQEDVLLNSSKSAAPWMLVGEDMTWVQKQKMMRRQQKDLADRLSASFHKGDRNSSPSMRSPSKGPRRRGFSERMKQLSQPRSPATRSQSPGLAHNAARNRSARIRPELDSSRQAWSISANSSQDPNNFPTRSGRFPFNLARVHSTLDHWDHAIHMVASLVPGLATQPTEREWAHRHVASSSSGLPPPPRLLDFCVTQEQAEDIKARLSDVDCEVSVDPIEHHAQSGVCIHRLRHPRDESQISSFVASITTLSVSQVRGLLHRSPSVVVWNVYASQAREIALQLCDLGAEAQDVVMSSDSKFPPETESAQNQGKFAVSLMQVNPKHFLQIVRRVASILAEKTLPVFFFGVSSKVERFRARQALEARLNEAIEMQRNLERSRQALEAPPPVWISPHDGSAYDRFPYFPPGDDRRITDTDEVDEFKDFGNDRMGPQARRRATAVSTLKYLESPHPRDRQDQSEILLASQRLQHQRQELRKERVRLEALQASLDVQAQRSEQAAGRARVRLAEERAEMEACLARQAAEYSHQMEIQLTAARDGKSKKQLTQERQLLEQKHRAELETQLQIVADARAELEAEREQWEVQQMSHSNEQAEARVEAIAEEVEQIRLEHQERLEAELERMRRAQAVELARIEEDAQRQAVKMQERKLEEQMVMLRQQVFEAQEVANDADSAKRELHTQLQQLEERLEMRDVDLARTARDAAEEVEVRVQRLTQEAAEKASGELNQQLKQAQDEAQEAKANAIAAHQQLSSTEAELKAVREALRRREQELSSASSAVAAVDQAALARLEIAKARAVQEERERLETLWQAEKEQMETTFQQRLAQELAEARQQVRAADEELASRKQLAVVSKQQQEQEERLQKLLQDERHEEENIRQLKNQAAEQRRQMDALREREQQELRQLQSKKQAEEQRLEDLLIQEQEGRRKVQALRQSGQQEEAHLQELQRQKVEAETLIQALEVQKAEEAKLLEELKQEEEQERVKLAQLKQREAEEERRLNELLEREDAEEAKLKRLLEQEAEEQRAVEDLKRRGREEEAQLAVIKAQEAEEARKLQALKVEHAAQERKIEELTQQRDKQKRQHLDAEQPAWMKKAAARRRMATSIVRLNTLEEGDLSDNSVSCRSDDENSMLGDDASVFDPDESQIPLTPIPDRVRVPATAAAAAAAAAVAASEESLDEMKQSTAIVSGSGSSWDQVDMLATSSLLPTIDDSLSLEPDDIDRSKQSLRDHIEKDAMYEQFLHLKKGRKVSYYIELLVLAEDLPKKTAPFVQVMASRNRISELVAETEKHEEATVAHFSPLVVNMEVLCHLQLQRLITYKIMHQDTHGDHEIRPLGTVTASVTDLQGKLRQKMRIDPDIGAGTKSRKFKKGATIGSISMHAAHLMVDTTWAYSHFPDVRITRPALDMQLAFTHCVLRMSISGSHLNAKKKLLGGRGSPFFELYRQIPNATQGWEKKPFFTSAVRIGEKVSWPRLYTKLHLATCGSAKRPILFRVLSAHSIGSPSVIGTLEATLKQIISKKGKKFYLKDPKTGKQAANGAYLSFKSCNIFSRLQDLDALVDIAGIRRHSLQIDDMDILKERAQKIGLDIIASDEKARLSKQDGSRKGQAALSRLQHDYNLRVQ